MELILIGLLALSGLFIIVIGLYLLALGLWLAWIVLIAVPFDLLFLLGRLLGIESARKHASLTIDAFEIMFPANPHSENDLLTGIALGWLLAGRNGGCG